MEDGKEEEIGVSQDDKMEDEEGLKQVSEEADEEARKEADQEGEALKHASNKVDRKWEKSIAVRDEITSEHDGTANSNSFF
jgi:hypothetical protein